MLVRKAKLGRVARVIPFEMYLVFEITRVTEVEVVRAKRMFAG